MGTNICIPPLSNKGINIQKLVTTLYLLKDDGIENTMEVNGDSTNEIKESEERSDSDESKSSSPMEILMNSINNQMTDNEILKKDLKVPPKPPNYSEEDVQKSKNSKTAALFYKHGKLEDFDKSKGKTDDEKKEKAKKKKCCFLCCC